MRACRLMTAILGVLLVAAVADAQEKYPTKPIRLIVPFPPGGPSDIVARMLAQKVSETFKQQVLVDNRPGGGGAIGIESAVRANPDGYTMLFVSGSSYAANAALYKLPYDPVNDVAPIALIDEGGNLVTLHPHVPYKGTSPALTDLLGGQIQVIFGNLAVMLPQVKLTRLRGIALTTAKRSSAAPDIPAIAKTTSSPAARGSTLTYL